jgi:uncharacterized protein (DUF2236 family)
MVSTLVRPVLSFEMAPAGYFTDDSMLRRVQREIVVALAGPRALLMQATHPVAFAGFFASTTALEDPYPRLERTAKVLHAIAWGTKAEADAATAPVRRVHARVRGALGEPVGRFPAGTPWRADDPELLLWVIATLVDSNLLVYQRYVGALTREDREAYWQDFRTLSERFGLAREHTPPDIGAFEAYMRDMLASGDLAVSEQARELAVDIVMRPPLPAHLLPLRELVNQITVGLLPGEIRRLYGFGWDPLRAAAVRGGQEYVRRVVVPLLPDRLRLSPSARAA